MSRKKRDVHQMVLKIGELTQAVDSGKLCSNIIGGFGGEEGLAKATVAEFYANEPGSAQRARILELAYKVLEARGKTDDAILKDIDREDLVAALSAALEGETDDKPAAPATGEGKEAGGADAADSNASQ